MNDHEGLVGLILGYGREGSMGAFSGLRSRVPDTEEMSYIPYLLPWMRKSFPENF